jgi:hypothetical protein
VNVNWKLTTKVISLNFGLLLSGFADHATQPITENIPINPNNFIRLN